MAKLPHAETLKDPGPEIPAVEHGSTRDNAKEQDCMISTKISHPRSVHVGEFPTRETPTKTFCGELNLAPDEDLQDPEPKIATVKHR